MFEELEDFNDSAYFNGTHSIASQIMAIQFVEYLYFRNQQS